MSPSPLQFLRHTIGLRSPIRLVYHYLRGLTAFALSGNPAKGMYIIGVTGTKGKTTTSTLIAAALEQSGRTVALLSTAQVWMAGEKRENQSKMTMDSPFKLWKSIQEAKRNGVTHLVLETSSHGIYYFRNFGIRYNAVVLTNISQDHLDLHGTMDHYARTKTRIFKPEPGKICVLPKDSEYFDLFLAAVNGKQGEVNRYDSDPASLPSTVYSHLITYSMKGFATYQAHGLKITENGIDMLIRSVFPVNEEALISAKIVGVFNAENLLAAYSLLRAIGIETKVMHDAWIDFTGVPGRLERVPNNRGITVLVDYAHTEKSLQSVLEAIGGNKKTSNRVPLSRGMVDPFSVVDTSQDELLRRMKDQGVQGIKEDSSIGDNQTPRLSTRSEEHLTSPLLDRGATGRIILVFGATGDRDTTKRPKMGATAHELADIVVLTDDDTYTESSSRIIDMIKEGIPREIGDTFQVIPDRREAISWAINVAKKGDIVLLAGKGCETVQLTNNGPIPWSDRGIAEEYLV